MTRIANLRGALTNTATHQGDVPFLKLALGLLLVAFFLLALMLQIQTSEAYLLHSTVVTLAPNWGILRQPVDLAQGALPLNQAKAAMWGWGIELIYLVCVIGEVSIHGRLNGWFKTGAFILVCFNFWTDLNYGSLASGLWGQIGFAGVTSFMVAFFGVVGLGLIWKSILEWGSR